MTASPSLQAALAAHGDAVLMLDAAALPADQTSAREAFASGKLVAISTPSAAKTVTLRKTLGLPEIGSIVCEGADLYGLIKTATGIEQLVIQPPVLPPEAAHVAVDHDDRAAALVAVLAKIDATSSKVPAHGPRVGAAAVGDGDPIDLFNQGIQYTNRVQWCLPVLNHAKTPVNCYFQLILKAQAVWVKDAGGNEYDYYFLIQYGVFSPGPGYISNDSNNQGWYVTYYETNAYPTDYLGNADMFMAQNSPGTTQGETTVSTSISTTTGISIGFFGETGTANFSESVSIGSSTSYQIPDVSVVNQSNTQGNNANWQFEMPYVAGDLALGQPVNMSVSSFQPVNMMLWQAGNSIRNAIMAATPSGSTPTISFTTEFSMQYVYTYVQGSRQDSTYKPSVQTTVFTVPVPPKQNPPTLTAVT